jgi:uncharacterized protein YcbK (DUF882 family)
MFSGMLAAGGASALLQPASALAATPDASDMRRIAFLNTHTGDAFSDVYWAQGNYVPDAMDAIRRVMRDHRTNETHDIDPQLLDQLHALHTLVEAGAPYQIISGYRSPATNAALHARSDGVAVRSLHMDGRAIDIRVQGVELARLRDAALSMNAGGVGYYEASDFIHVDTGRVRRW